MSLHLKEKLCRHSDLYSLPEKLLGEMGLMSEHIPSTYDVRLIHLDGHFADGISSPVEHLQEASST